MDYLSKLIRDGRVSLYHDYRSGGAWDFSGNDFHGDPNYVTFNKDGFIGAWTGTLGRIDLNPYASESALVLDDEMSVLVIPRGDLGKRITGVVGDDAFFCRGSGANTNYQFWYSTSLGDLGLSVNGTTYYTTTQVSIIDSYPKFDSVGFTTKKDEVVNFYIDGKLYSSSSTTIPATITTTATTVRVGASITIGINTRQGVSGIVVVKEKLTEYEMAQIHSSLMNMKFSQKPSGKKKYFNFVDTSDSSLWVGYNGKLSENSFIDLGDSFYNIAKIEGPLAIDSLFGTAIRFTGSGYYQTTAPNDTLTAVTIECMWKPRGTTNGQRIMEIGQNDIELNVYGSGQSIYSKVNNSSAYVQDDGLPLETWHHVVMTYANGSGGKMYIDGAETASSTISDQGNLTAFTDITLGADYTGTLNAEGDLLPPKIYSEVKSDTWIAERYAEIAKTIQFKTDWGTYATENSLTSGDHVENSPFIIHSGTWKVKVEEVNGKPTKILSCTAAGIAYVPMTNYVSETENTYGTWDFWILKSGAAPRMIFTADVIGAEDAANQEGYSILISSTWRVYLRELSGGSISNVFYTDLDYVVDDTWYHFKVTRKYDNYFSVYMDDALVIEASGSNPGQATSVTSTKYMVLDFDGGDQIALGSVDGSNSIVKYLGVV